MSAATRPGCSPGRHWGPAAVGAEGIFGVAPEGAGWFRSRYRTRRLPGPGHRPHILGCRGVSYGVPIGYKGWIVDEGFVAYLFDILDECLVLVLGSSSSRRDG